MNNPAQHHVEQKSINRVLGQLTGVKTMIQEERYCIDILTQLKAARKAIKSIEINILNSHMSHCVAHAIQSNDAKDISLKMDEIKLLLKNFTGG